MKYGKSKTKVQEVAIKENRYVTFSPAWVGGCTAAETRQTRPRRVSGVGAVVVWAY